RRNLISGARKAPFHTVNVRKGAFTTPEPAMRTIAGQASSSRGQGPAAMPNSVRRGRSPACGSGTFGQRRRGRGALLAGAAEGGDGRLVEGVHEVADDAGQMGTGCAA